jgi:cytochrome c553
MTRLAKHFAAMPGLAPAPAGTTANRAAAQIIRVGRPDLQLPACASCHAPGKPYPVLTGQRASYLAQRLRQWRGDETIVDARKSQATMPVIARRIPEDMIVPLATALAGR